MTDERIEADKVVQINYKILDQDGSVLELMDMPIDYMHGRDSGLFQQIEEALEGCTAGDRVSVTLAPEEAFGQPDPELVITDDLQNVPSEFQELGKEVDFQSDQGDVKTFTVTDISNGTLTVDGNHPLAGKTLTFVVEVTKVRDATPEELAEGTPAGADRVH